MNVESCLDKAVLDALMQLGGKDFVAKMLELYMGYAPQQLALARAAHLANDLAGVQNAVHPLKSSSGQIGARVMHDLAAQIELCTHEKSREPIGPLLSELEAAYEVVKVHLQEHRRQIGS